MTTIKTLFSDVALVILMALALPLAILLVGTPIALLARLFVEIVLRLL